MDPLRMHPHFFSGCLEYGGKNNNKTKLENEKARGKRLMRHSGTEELKKKRKKERTEKREERGKEENNK